MLDGSCTVLPQGELKTFDITIPSFPAKRQLRSQPELRLQVTDDALGYINIITLNTISCRLFTQMALYSQPLELPPMLLL